MTTERNANPTTRQRSASYPRYNLEQVEKLARAAFEIGPRNCDQDRVAQALDYKNAQNGAFMGLRSSANQFGLITTRGQYLSVTDEWIRVFNEDNPEILRAARREAMRQPELYRKLIEEYAGRQFPTLEKLARELHLTPKYGILKDAAKAAAEVFIESARYAELFDSRGYLQVNDIEGEAADKSSNERQRDPGRASNRQPSQQTASELQTGQPVGSGYESVSIPQGLDRHEIRMRNGQKAYMFVPVPLPSGEKERLKKYIDLMLEEDPQDVSRRPGIPGGSATDIVPAPDDTA